MLSSSRSILRAGLLLFVSLALVMLTLAGILFWAWHGSILGVALSALLPGLCAMLLLPTSHSGGRQTTRRHG